MPPHCGGGVYGSLRYYRPRGVKVVGGWTARTRVSSWLPCSRQCVCCLPEALMLPPTVMVEVCIKQIDLKRPPQDSRGQEQPLGPLLLDSVT